MHIQSYQIHNVLNVYRRQLSRNSIIQTGKSENDSVTISIEGKKQSIMNKVAASVIEKITQIPSPQNGSAEDTPETPTHPLKTVDGNTLQLHAFTFNTIVENNHKETRSIAIDDSQVLMNRLNELAKAVVDKTVE
ncbi:conserved hypothetical protein [Desulfosarcina cetonica]|uniref:DVU0524 family FlgM-associated protein n=1 Tax=Desulfosarcina cetonica TaxID=90730 RepID=UPI0012EE61E0|nr:DVU0524 family FlgM-associated protein [Desulfosarcina cetonica]VTR65376.1 conserved hypothetical protein [Desulfosarcina cetonica]